MPREQVNFPQQVTSDSPPGYVTTEPTLHVGWNRAGWVQVSIETDVESMRKIVDSYEAGVIGAVFTEPLDRDEINKLIRLLRKARDAAYGSDA